MNDGITLPPLGHRQGQPPLVSTVIRLECRPHLESGGYHLDRFSVFHGGERIIRSTRSPLYAGARALLERGHDPAQMVTIRLGRRGHDSFVPASIGDLARWTIEESDQRGLSRREWRPFSGRVAHDARRPLIASTAPEVKREALCGATPGGAMTMSEVDAA
jgi:hypothetical protein